MIRLLKSGIYRLFYSINQFAHFDYRTGQKLFDYRKPLSPLFMPLPAHSEKFPPANPTQNATSRTFIPSGAATPLPAFGSSYDSSPAWDPSSRTPALPLENDTSIVDDGQDLALSSDNPTHPLLDSRLVGVRLKVVVNGGDYNDKEVVAFIDSLDGRPYISHENYHVVRRLAPEWVSLKHPSPTRDNGLLVVVKGQHCGKYVRRVHHRYDNMGPVIISAVVNRSDGLPDVLAGEVLDLSPDFLCLCPEAAALRKQNDIVMRSSRKQARKEHARQRVKK